MCIDLDCSTNEPQHQIDEVAFVKQRAATEFSARHEEIPVTFPRVPILQVSAHDKTQVAHRAYLTRAQPLAEALHWRPPSVRVAEQDAPGAWLEFPCFISVDAQRLLAQHPFLLAGLHLQYLLNVVQRRRGNDEAVVFRRRQC